MFRAATRRLLNPVVCAEQCLAAGSFVEALQHLNAAKASALSPSPFVDYLRALCFLKLKDPHHARQALLEELRLHESNEDARDLLHRVDTALGSTLQLPESVIAAEPLFAMLYEGLKGHTMLQWPRLLSLFNHAREVCEEGVPGDFVECGVAGGGSAVMLAAAAAHFTPAGAPRRRVIACDSFSGMPRPTATDSIDRGTVAADASAWGTGTCAAPEAAVQDLASALNVDVITVPGLFESTLPKLVSRAPSDIGVSVDRIALLHVDSDWYESTQACLRNLFPRVSRGGILQIDDFHYWDGCKQAVNEYLQKQGISTGALHDVDGNAVWMRK